MAKYQSLIGRQWKYGVNDCFTLIRDWFALKGVELPDFERPDDLETCDSIFLREAEALGFAEVPLSERQYGDVLIMRLDTAQPMHAAVLVDPNTILHQRQDSLSTLEPLRRYYLARAVAVFRYAASGTATG